MKKMIALIAAMLPAAASAQEMSGMLTLGYSSTDIPGLSDDLSGATLDFAGSANFANGFSLSGGVGLSNHDTDGLPGQLQMSTYDLEASYAFGNHWSLGAYAEKSAMELTIINEDISMRSFGLTMGYKTDRVAVELYAGKSETDPEMPAGLDLKDAGLRMSFAVSDRTNMTLRAGLSRLSGAGIPDVDLTAIGLSATHMLTDRWMVFGGLDMASLDVMGDSLDATSVGLGAGYRFDISGRPVLLTMELARTSLSVDGLFDEDLDTIRVGLSLPLGAAGTKAPLNSLASSVAEGRHSTLTSTLLGVF